MKTIGSTLVSFAIILRSKIPNLDCLYNLQIATMEKSSIPLHCQSWSEHYKTIARVVFCFANILRRKNCAQMRSYKNAKKSVKIIL